MHLSGTLTLALMSLAYAGHAQTVRVPAAQAIIDSLLRQHPEIQTIGLHTKPPGLADNLNIACSKPGKVGKLSAAIDIHVIETGQPSLRRAKLGAYDIGVPIGDAAGRPFGMIVVVLPERYAVDEKEALRKVFAIRDELSRQISSKALFHGASLVKAPLVMIAQTPLPGVKGQLGPVTLDPAAQQVAVEAAENGTVEILDLEGERIGSKKLRSAGDAVPGPNAVDKATRRRFSVRGDKILIEDSGSNTTVAKLDGVTGPGSVIFDGASHLLFVTGEGGLAIYLQKDADVYTPVARFGTMHGKYAAYLPSRKRLYIAHGANAEDGAGLQIYQLRD